MITFVLGDYAIAKLCKKLYKKVQIVKDNDGRFHDEMVIGFSTIEDGSFEFASKICYHVEICHTKQKLWVPWENLHLSERSRPFYGRDDKKSPPLKNNNPKKQRKVYADHTLPMTIKPHSTIKPDLNVTYDQRHMPKLNKIYENAFREFVRRGKEMIFDDFLKDKYCWENKEKHFEKLFNSGVFTEDKFEMLLDNVVTEKEVENHLYQCWRYNVICKEDNGNDMESPDAVLQDTEASSTNLSVHTNWCSVCGKRNSLVECPKCPACFHVGCKNKWVIAMLHRKNPPKSLTQGVLINKKKLSSTRTIKSYQKNSVSSEICPGCLWGPSVGYGDVVWNKLGNCPWWPAKVLAPGSLPSCLVSRKHSVQQWPVRYYGTLNHSWCDTSRMCLFLPSHTAVLDEDKPEDLQEAVMDACDDYIAVYLT